MQKYDIKNIISLYSQLYFIILSSTLFLEIMEFRSSIICNLGDPSRVQIMVNQLPFPALPSNTSSGNKLPFSTLRTYTPLGNLLPYTLHSHLTITLLKLNQWWEFVKENKKVKKKQKTRKKGKKTRTRPRK